MTPDRAREIIEDWIYSKVTDGTTSDPLPVHLPIKDEVIYSENYKDWTFVGLIKIAYNL